MADARRDALIASAQRIGADPLEYATVMSYETGGTFNPSIRGGAGNRHIGLIQFGIPEQQKYGARQDQSFEEQLPAVEAYLTDRGFKPGMGIFDLYSTINAGRPGRYNASDAGNGGAPGTVADKVNQQMGGHRTKAAAFLGGDFTPVMPGESAPAGRAPFSLSGPVGSTAPAPTVPAEPAKPDPGPDVSAILKMLSASQGAAASQASAAGAPALPAPLPAPAPRPVAFDPAKFFALLPSRR